MGAWPYWYFVPYQERVEKALADLRGREFRAGRYYPVIRLPNFSDPDFLTRAPGARHRTIEEAIEDAGASGTRSILDISRAGAEPAFGTASPLDPETIEELYGTSDPTRAMVERNMGFVAEVGRGECVYLVLFEGGQPAEICFAGYSYD
jgi:hypothetical protein